MSQKSRVLPLQRGNVIGSLERSVEGVFSALRHHRPLVTHRRVEKNGVVTKNELTIKIDLANQDHAKLRSSLKKFIDQIAETIPDQADEYRARFRWLSDEEKT